MVDSAVDRVQKVNPGQSENVRCENELYKQ